VSGDARRAQPELPDAGGPASDAPVVLYDGWCNLCDSSVALILRRDRQAVFRFAALQSAAGRTMRGACSSTDRLDGTLVVMHGGRCRTRSDAVVTVLSLLPRPWSYLAWMRLVPRPWRDRVYDQVARHRATWFGRPQACMTSLGGYRDRFLG